MTPSFLALAGALRTELALAISRQPRYLHGAKAILALAAAGLLLWGWRLARSGEPERHRRLRDRLLAALAVLGLAGGWNFGLGHLDHYIHYWDLYGNYLGAKYAPELGFTRLYACTSVADLQLGWGSEVARRPIRNLVTDRGETNDALLRDSSPCTRYFTRARWTAFRNDIAWFHTKFSVERWNLTQIDHGFNATPVWSLTAWLLANTGPASDGQALALVLIDVALVVSLFAMILWAFGWRAAAVSAIVFGTNTAADFAWIGGSILRYDWLFFAVVSVCLLRKGRPFLAGLALGWAALIRVFPLLFGAGVGLKALAQSSRDRWRFVAGGLVSAALLVPLSLVPSGAQRFAPDNGWRGFVANSRKHLDAPSANNMGLKTLLSVAPERPPRLAPGDDPGWVWWQPHAEALAARMPLFWLLLALFGVLLARAALRQPDWAATLASLGLVPFALTVSCYYYVLLLGYGLLVVLGEGWGAAACALAAATGICAVIGAWDYEVYTLTSAVVLVFAALAAAGLGTVPRDAREGK